MNARFSNSTTCSNPVIYMALISIVSDRALSHGYHLRSHIFQRSLVTVAMGRPTRLHDVVGKKKRENHILFPLAHNSYSASQGNLSIMSKSVPVRLDARRIICQPGAIRSDGCLCHYPHVPGPGGITSAESVKIRQDQIGAEPE